jgi:hypothetical protein
MNEEEERVASLLIILHSSLIAFFGGQTSLAHPT